jgi:chromosome segregation and condensation protein ScpB
MNNQDLAKTIEALLFTLGRPLSRKELIEKLETTGDDIELALKDLRSVQNHAAL